MTYINKKSYITTFTTSFDQKDNCVQLYRRKIIINSK